MRWVDLRDACPVLPRCMSCASIRALRKLREMDRLTRCMSCACASMSCASVLCFRDACPVLLPDQRRLQPKCASRGGSSGRFVTHRTARAELTRRGLEKDEKAVRRIAGELGAQMLATRTRDLMRFRHGRLPAGNEFAGQSIAAEINGGRVRVRTIGKKSRVSGKTKRKKSRVKWREPKVVILFEVDKKGRMVRGSRPLIDGTLQGPDALIELVAFHLHRIGAAKANVVTFAADSAPWIWKRLDWIVAQVGLEACRVVEVLDWCHAVHHVSVALASLPLAEDKQEAYKRLRRLLKEGKSRAVISELETLAIDEGEDSSVWREIRYLTKHSDAGRLRYNCFRCRGVPIREWGDSAAPFFGPPEMGVP